MDVTGHNNRESIIRCYFRVFPPRGVSSILDIGAGRTAPYRGVLSSRTDEYTTLDIRPGPDVDYCIDLTEGSSFPTGRFAWGWSSECLEHIPHPLQTAFVNEATRVCQNVVFTFPTPRHPTFYGDPGHVTVVFDWSSLMHTRNVFDFSFKTGRSVKVVTQKNLVVAATNKGLYVI